MSAVVIGIAGGSGSGKSTLVRAVRHEAPQESCTLAFDSYYRDQSQLSIEQRRRVNYDHPEALDVDRFAADLDQLRSGRALAAPVYDFANYTRSTDVELVDPRPIIIVDGILLFVFDEICALCDVKVFVEVTDAVRTRRRVERDIQERGRTREFAMNQIERTVRPMYGEFVHPSRDRADLVVDGTAEPGHSARQVLARLAASVTVD